MKMIYAKRLALRVMRFAYIVHLVSVSLIVF